MPVLATQILTWSLTLFLGLLTFFNARAMARRTKREREKDIQEAKHQEELKNQLELRKDESWLTLNLLRAVLSLSNATAIAVINQKINGEMDSALRELKEADNQWEKFMFKHGLEAVKFE